MTSMQTYFGTGNILLGVFFAKLETLNCRRVTLEKRDRLVNVFFEIVEMLEHSLLCMHFSEKHL